ncbi:hypothetical protein [Pseudoxanthomonas wuyuanensis]|uniref:Uncharacterized protein n=1 Tax=Pseudoxanthomonas wuyuanensis TaxID=1073196 RepID=A0A286CW30_9GAMM|nr:hypothetical protein [Pseudoxanthomonas wuyuanensis]KAF1721241.1 hypothetical protein CSC75_07420 [Pseudoxanthomonas wuyuanensis]SOD50585.1 hypothetical protein SAMN06296416_101195 [Pseudoxanthomonas wuyuanensis]
MIFAVATDERTLFVFSSAAAANAYCEGIDVEDGGWLFWDEAGTALAPEFLTSNYRDKFTVGSGTYQLVPAPHRPLLAEVITEINHLEANPYFADLSAVRTHFAIATRTSQHGAQ